MTPIAWSFDAILMWEEFPPGAFESPGVWVCGTTTLNQISQGTSPQDALDSLVSCLAIGAHWDLEHGRDQGDLFRIRRAGEVPIASMSQQNDETRITSAAEATDKTVRYIVSGTVTIEQIKSVGPVETR